MKQKTRIFSSVLFSILFVFLAVLAFPGRAIAQVDDYAEVELDGEKEVENPYTNIWSEDEIRQAVNSGKIFLYKNYLIKDGQEVPLNPTRGNYIMKPGKYVQYSVFLPRNDGGRNFERIYSLSVRAERIYFNESEKHLTRLPDGERLNRKTPIDSIFMNGKKQEIGKFGTRFNIKGITKAQYGRMEFTVKGNEAYLFIPAPAIISSSDGRTPFVSSPQYILTARSNFHFVDDLDYRRLKGLKIDEDIPARNAGKLPYSFEAHNSLNIEDLSQEKYSESPFMLKPNGNRAYDFKAPLLRPTGEAPEFKPNARGSLPYYRVNWDNSVAATYIDELNPSLQELKEEKIPGYVYIGHDIDLPEGEDDFSTSDASLKNDGNHYNSIAIDKDGNRLSEKNYYVTFRPLGKAVTIEKHDLDQPNKGLAGAKFDLYRIFKDGDNNKEILVRKDLTTDKKGQIVLAKNRTMDELTSMIKEPTSLAEWKKGIYVDKSSGSEEIFLTPGEYILKETQAPAGYNISEENKEVNFEITRVIDDNSISQTIKISNKKSTTGDHKDSPILKIIKVDGDGNRISLPVSFKLSDKAYPSLGKTLITNNRGEAEINSLSSGDYKLEEIVTPEGYKPLEEPVEFTVVGGKAVRYEGKLVRYIYVTNDKKATGSITEIDGKNRQDVAVDVSKNYFPDAKKLILVQDMAYADSMSAMNISKGQIPILYVGKDTLYDVTKAEILRTKRDEIYVMGGENTITKRLFEEVKGLNHGKVTRVYGSDRFEVNKNSLEYFGDYKKAVIASGMIYTDALSSVPYAHQENAPILLVRKSSVPEYVANAIEKADEAILSGGPNTVDETCKGQIDKLLGKSVDRIDGKDRYAVSAKLAGLVKDPKTAIVTSGEKWSDALTAGPLAQKLGAPILLTAQSKLPQLISDYLEARRGIEELIIIGGPASVGSQVREALKALYK